MALINDARRNLDEQLEIVCARLDWGDPRIAFYGETNAGKSTLIEALRLSFDAHEGVPGLTIGDGSPDFTREAAAYPCGYGDLRFSLLDVPGIEGDESKVADRIEAAVGSAHLVFFVTADARPPQGGDVQNLGTLDKIRLHLRPQTKVWAVYNKKITNPRQLGASLVTADEQRSLSDGPNSLDGKLGEALGCHYQGYVCVSALPGFLAQIEESSGNERFNAQRAKFLASLNAIELLRSSGIDRLAGLITSNVPSPAQVIEANARKLGPAIRDAADILLSDADHAFLFPMRALSGRIAGLEMDLKAIADDATRSMGRLADEITNGSIKRVRQTMLDAISAGIDDDDALKRRLDETLSREKGELGDVVSIRLRSTAKRIQQSCEEALQLLASRLRRDDAFESATFAAAFAHASKVETRSGLDWLGLGGSVLGLAIAGFTIGTAGVGLAIITAIGGVMGIWNSIKFWVDGNFKKDQQKRALNINLDELRPAIRADVVGALNAAEMRLRTDVLDVLARLRSMLDEHDDAWRRVQVVAAEFGTLADDDKRLVAKTQEMRLDKITAIDKADPVPS